MCGRVLINGLHVVGANRFIYIYILPGTWKSQPGVVEGAVEHALKFGYRHIDTATAYANESDVGTGIKASGVPRSDIFLTTKLNNTDHGDPATALEYSLNALGTNYLDLCTFNTFDRATLIVPLILELVGLMHWPAPMHPDGTPDKTVSQTSSFELSDLVVLSLSARLTGWILGMRWSNFTRLARRSSAQLVSRPLHLGERMGIMLILSV